VDFGVAAAWRESSSDDLTREDFVIGSPKYMAPEQIAGKKIDHRADIYALGVILYEMSTGVPPYDGRDHVAIMFGHVQGKARPPAELNPELSPELCTLIMQAMAVDKRRRFQSMPELRAALQQHF
jgi:serine/threonine-protein kinase